MTAPGRLEQVVGGVEGVRAGRGPHRGHVARCAAAPARAGGTAARPSRADGSPSPPGIDSVPARPARHAARRRDPRPTIARPHRRSPCPDPHAPTTCTASSVPFDPRLSPDGTPRGVHASSGRAVGRDGYRYAIWLASTDGSTPARQVTHRRRDRTADRASRRTAGRSRSSRDRRLLRRGGARPAEGGQGPRSTATRCSCCRSTAARRAA